MIVFDLRDLVTEIRFLPRFLFHIDSMLVLVLFVYISLSLFCSFSLFLWV